MTGNNAMAGIILNFHELCHPVRNSPEGDGHDWVCYDIDATNCFWLFNNGRCQLGDLLEVDSAEFMFDSELDAHFAASAYYVSRNAAYPYIKEFAVALARHIPKFDDEDVGSRTMEFI